MKKIVCLMLLFMGACGPETKSIAKSETVMVEDVISCPARHGSGSGTGFSTSGHVVFTSTEVDIPPVTAVVFRCEHGKFVSERKDIWEKAIKGATYKANYDEIWTDEPESKFVKYHLVSIEPIKQ